MYKHVIIVCTRLECSKCEIKRKKGSNFIIIGMCVFIMSDIAKFSTTIFYFCLSYRDVLPLCLSVPSWVCGLTEQPENLVSQLGPS